MLTPHLLIYQGSSSLKKWLKHKTPLETIVYLNSFLIHLQQNSLLCLKHPLKLHLAISEFWFGQEWEGMLLELLCSSSIV